MAGTVHTVAEGEHISAIAARYGFGSHIPVWNAPANTELRSLRTDPHQLVPGDKIAIPERQFTQFERHTDAVHPFVVQIDKLKVRLRLLDFAFNPIPNLSANLDAGLGGAELTTDAEGLVVSRIARDGTSGTLEINENEYEFGIGALPPASVPAGQAARLMNLGYWYGDDQVLDDPEVLTLAIQLFQRDRGLTMTGEADEALISALQDIHDGKGA